MTSAGSENDPVAGLILETIGLINEETAAGAVSDIYEANRPLLEKHGWKVAQVLGSGQNGTAFALADGERVMKITLDDSEARSSFAIAGRKNEHIVNIEKVFKLPKREGLRDAYVLIQERLYPLPDKRRRELDDAIRFIDKLCEKDMNIWVRGWAHFKNVVEYQVDRFDEGDGKIELQANAALKVLKNIGVGAMMDETLRRGIRFYDYHVGNILMRKDGTPVINDLGVSKAIKDLDPPTLEKREMAEAKPVFGTRDTGAAQLGTAQLGGKSERISKVASLTDLADRFGGLLRKNGLELARVLGEGSMGVAYELKDGRVLKITTDPTEARAAYYVLKLKGVKGIARIDQVFRFPDMEIYGVVQEKLQPLPENVDKLFLWAFKEIVWKLFGRKGAGNTDRGWKFMVNRVQQELVDASPAEKKAATKALEVYQRLGLDKIMDALVAKGIRFHDLHPGNLMMRKPGEYVVIDLGVSDVAGGGAGPPTLESVVDEAIIAIVNESVTMPDVEALRPFLQQNGIQLGQHIGEGHVGHAFELAGKPNVIVKVTDDVNEAQSSYRVQKYGKNLRHVVRIYDVRKIPGGTSPRVPDDTYVITQERLQPLSDEGDRLVTAATRVLRLDNRFALPAVRDQAVRMLRDKLGGQAEGVIHLLDSIQYFETMEELKSIGVRFKDYHAGNVMMRGQDFVVLDLGVSKVQGGTEPPPIGPGVKTESFDPHSLLEWKRLLEGPADRVAVVAAGLSPFSARQADFVRRVANSVDKVVLVLWAGAGASGASPELVRASLRDVDRKVEVAIMPRTDSLLGSLEGLMDKSPALRPGASFELYVPGDDVDDAQTQMKSSGVFGDAPVVVRPIDPKIAGVDRQAADVLRTGDVEKAKSVFDPHLFSDPEEAEEIISGLASKGRVEGFVSRVSAVILEDLLDVGGEDGIRSVLGANATQLKLKKNVDVEKVRVLGSGQKGTAFLVRPGTVLKVTTDEKEARSSVMVKGKTLRHIARIYDVFRFGKTPGTTEPVFGIIMEELEPLSESDAAELNRALMLIRDMEHGPEGDQVLEALANGRFDEMVGMLRQIWTREMSAEAGSPAAKRRVAQQVEAKIQELQRAMDQYKIPDMVKELTQSGVEFADFKAENMGKRSDGTIVVFDLGASRTQGGQPPVFEVSMAGDPGDRQTRRPSVGKGRAEPIDDRWRFEDEGPGRLGPATLS